MRKQRKKEYESPMVCALLEIEIESPIMGPSNHEIKLKVDGLRESYYDGTSDYEDYQINF